MKQKFSLWLNIVTICLCVCAIAIGVYAATNATLTVSGQIGFNAHGCNIKITDYTITNASRDGAATTTTEIKNYLVGETLTDFDTEAGMSVADNTSFNIGDIYFVDNVSTGLVEDIKITFEITNNSAFNVKATVTNATAEDSKITVYSDEWALLGTTAESKTQEIEITLSLQKQANGEYPEKINLNDLDITVDFDRTLDSATSYKQGVTVKKFTDEYATSVKETLGTVEYDNVGEIIEYGFSEDTPCYVDKYPFYVELGQNPVDKTVLRWLVVGKDSSGTMVALEQTDLDALAKGYMLNNVDYYLISEYYLSADVASKTGLVYNNDYIEHYTIVDEGSFIEINYKDADNSNELANNYIVSTLRDYLKGETVQISTKLDRTENLDLQNGYYRTNEKKYYIPDGKNVNYYETYNLKSSALFDKIQARPITQLGATSGEEADEFWVFSVEECNTVFPRIGFARSSARGFLVNNTTTEFAPYSYLVGETLTRTAINGIDDQELGTSIRECVAIGDETYCRISEKNSIRPAFKI